MRAPAPSSIAQRSEAQESAVGTAGAGRSEEDQRLAMSGTFVSRDALRPPVIDTYDMRSNFNRILGFLNGFITPANSDLASTPTTTGPTRQWTRTLCGLYLRLLLQALRPPGLDDRNIRIRGFTHPVNRNDVFTCPTTSSASFSERLLRRRRPHGLRRRHAAGASCSAARAGTSSPARSTSSRTSSRTASPNSRRT